MIFQENKIQKRLGVSVLVCDKSDFNPKSTRRDKEDRADRKSVV